EDDREQAWRDLEADGIGANDVVIGIAASGTTPYVIGGLEACNARGILTGCITCNEGSPLALTAQFPVVVVVGPEFVTGSSRMKAGTAQKLVLNMISTATMIRLGRVKGNKMVDMQLSNDKLVDRGTRMIMGEIPVGYEEAGRLLQTNGSVRKAVEAWRAMNNEQ
ncbi:MAG TPA: N-acetylmuramic acid 6-phosphate etherase, partial [Flavobacterium sp.]|nr:N-acetylmuramic acid 6-phosphate etherase [Flavobacterium sp.]